MTKSELAGLALDKASFHAKCYNELIEMTSKVDAFRVGLTLDEARVVSTLTADHLNCYNIFTKFHDDLQDQAETEDANTDPDPTVATEGTES